MVSSTDDKALNLTQFQYSIFIAFVGTDITEDIQLVTNNKGSRVLFYNGFKYLKSGESRTSYQYRCFHYMKKCRSRIVFNRENKTAMKNEINHNHPGDPDLYDNFMTSAINTQKFGEKKKAVRLKQDKIVELEYEELEDN